MTRRLIRFVGLLGLAVGVAGISAHHHRSLAPKPVVAPAPQAARTPTHPEATSLLAKLPLSFVENHGQWPAPVQFQVQKGPMTAWLTLEGVALQLMKQEASGQVTAVSVHLVFEGASAQVQLAGETPHAGRFNYFLGNDPAQWQANVPSYAAVIYQDLYDGISLKVREHEGRLEYDVLLEPEADLRQVAIRAEGVDKLALTEDGSLVMHTAAGPLTQHPPTTWYEHPDGTTEPVHATFVLLDDHRYTFEVPHRNPQLALVIDPGLEWSTFLGGLREDAVYALARTLDDTGDVVVAGGAESANFPTTPGAYSTSLNNGLPGSTPFPSTDAFITRLTADGSSLVYSTFLGDSGYEQATSLALEGASGIITVAGWTVSPTFPTTPGAYSTTYTTGPGTNHTTVFLARLDPSGSTLLYSTYLGGSLTDDPRGVAVDTAGVITVTGRTFSPDFPTTPGAYDTTYNGGLYANDYDAFVARLNPAGNGTSDLVYSTYLGGYGHEEAFALTVTDTGDAIVVGITNSPEVAGTAPFPTTPGAYDTSLNAGLPPTSPYYFDGFVTRLSADGSTLLFSTYLGGSFSEHIHAVAVDPAGVIILAGSSGSPNFPTTPGAFDTTYNSGPGVPAPYVPGIYDAVVAKLSANGSNLLYATFLGGTSMEGATALSIDPSGAITVAGYTHSPNFPITPGAFNTIYTSAVYPNNGPLYGGGGTYPQGFVTRFNQNGSALIYSTFLGGLRQESIAAMALDEANAALVGGWTWSPNFPTTPTAFDPSFNSGLSSNYNNFPIYLPDAFVAKLDMLPTGVSRLGVATPGCQGAMALSVTSMPQVGNQVFRLAVTNAPPGTPVLVLISTSPAAPPVVFYGVTVFLDLTQVVLSFSTIADNRGSAEVLIPIPQLPTLVGATVIAQAFSGNAPPCSGYTASHALSITIQP